MFPYMKDTYRPVARHNYVEGLLMEKSSNHSTKCRGDPQETHRKYTGSFTGIVILAYLKDSESFVHSLMSIDKFFGILEFCFL